MPRLKEFDESEVLDKAIELFWKKGFNATSVQDLVTTLGVNRASLYATWGNKQQLYLTALKRYRQNSSTWLLDKIRSEQPAKKILEDFLLEAVEEAIKDVDRKGCFIVNSATELCNHDAQVNALFQENKSTIIQVLSELVKEAQDQGEIQSANAPEVIASFLYTTVVGLRVISKSESNEEELRSIVALALSSLK